GTAKRAVTAALTQFEGAEVEIIERPNIRTKRQVESVVKKAVKEKAFIVHTLVSNDVREAMLRTGRIYNISTFDLMGPLLERLSQRLSISPSMKPGLFRQLNEVYFRRVETMEFAFHHDDGLRPDDLSKAEIILVGVSRTFKTPLSIYLAIKGWWVANVPIILDMSLPEILDQLPGGIVFGLRADPYRLAELRTVRERRFLRATGDYAKPEYVVKEMNYSLHLFRMHPQWPVINVTSKPIEEIASEIIALSRPKKRDNEAEN
ncbi:MAG: kinase/pyrophosphorylase, partial [Calditrichia bacterium]|nr:kinase/pyrophosphorylase [Calditrichia bacterium]